MKFNAKPKVLAPAYAPKTDAARRAAFHATQRNHRRPSPAAQSLRSTAAANLYYDGSQDHILPVCADNYPSIDVPFWVARNVRQKAWEAAKEAMNGGHLVRSLLTGIAEEVHGCRDLVAIDRIEERAFGSAATAGPFVSRKMFWTLVNCCAASVVPRDLEFLVDVYESLIRIMDREDAARLAGAASEAEVATQGTLVA